MQNYFKNLRKASLKNYDDAFAPIVLTLRWGIRFYRLTLSPYSGGQCRFHPTCSAYALEALDVLPLGLALKKIVRRVLSCHPFHPGGFDPIIKANEGGFPSAVSEETTDLQMEGSGGERYLLPLL